MRCSTVSNSRVGETELLPSHVRPAVIGKSQEETPPHYHDGNNNTDSGTFREINIYKPEEELHISTGTKRFNVFI
ncbi:hypothetical protein DPMN_187448 [Dreissena polymorpha]|uniref:Uncharacterized protein n=1 Tax=Dreissena polymorpha TaxID=45954 RepID=A0A9D4DNC9_DREPO|nr:hypothetical protein DPMN_187448 [Dreissena polymorpha]